MGVVVTQNYSMYMTHEREGMPLRLCNLRNLANGKSILWELKSLSNPGALNAGIRDTTTEHDYSKDV